MKLCVRPVLNLSQSLKVMLKGFDYLNDLILARAPVRGGGYSQLPPSRNGGVQSENIRAGCFGAELRDKREGLLLRAAFFISCGQRDQAALCKGSCVAGKAPGKIQAAVELPS